MKLLRRRAAAAPPWPGLEQRLTREPADRAGRRQADPDGVLRFDDVISQSVVLMSTATLRNTPPQVLWQAAQLAYQQLAQSEPDSDAEVWWAEMLQHLADNQAAPPTLLRWLQRTCSQHLDTPNAVLRQLAANPGSPSDVLWQLGSVGLAALDRELAGNPGSPAPLLQQLVEVYSPDGCARTVVRDFSGFECRLRYVLLALSAAVGLGTLADGAGRRTAARRRLLEADLDALDHDRGPGGGRAAVAWAALPPNGVPVWGLGGGWAARPADRPLN